MSELNSSDVSINDIIKFMLNDPKSMAIWSEILIGNQGTIDSSQNLTAKDLYDRLDIGKSVLYTRLNTLVEMGVIQTEIISKDTAKKKRVPETLYKINESFTQSYYELIKNTENQLKNIRDYRLFHLYIVNSMLSREIRVLSKKSNEEIRSSISENQYYGFTESLSKKDHDYLQKELLKVHMKLKDVREGGNDKPENKKKKFLFLDNDYYYYSGFLKIN